MLSVTLSGSSRDGIAGAFVEAHAKGWAQGWAPRPSPIPLPAVLSHPVSTGTGLGLPRLCYGFDLSGIRSLPADLCGLRTAKQNTWRQPAFLSSFSSMLSGHPEPGSGAGLEGRWVSSRATCGCRMKAPRAPQSEPPCPPRGRGQRPISVRMCFRPLFLSRAWGEGVRPRTTMSPGCSWCPLHGARPAGPVVTAAPGVPVAGTRPVLRKGGRCAGSGGGRGR